MKKTITILITVYAGALFACSGFTKPFCHIHADNPGDAVIAGVITAMGGHSLQLHVIDVLHGTETRSTISVWDGKDYDCNGNIPMNVAGMGSVGDTILAILPMITSVVNAWDVIGDYQRPIYLYAESVLKISGDTVRGLVNGPANPVPPSWSVTKVRYDHFKVYWQQNQGNCTQFVAINEVEAHRIAQVFHYNGELIVRPAVDGPVRVTITSVTGSLVREWRVEESASIDMHDYSHGLYLVRVTDVSGAFFIQKIVY